MVFELEVVRHGIVIGIRKEEHVMKYVVGDEV